MKIKGAITLLISENGADIEIYDEGSRTTIIRGHLSVLQLGQALGRLAYTKMEECEVLGLDRVGKIMEMDTLEFPIDCDEYGPGRNEKARFLAHKLCPEGWRPDASFSSQDSFFQRDRRTWARTTIRRWVPPKDKEL